MLILSEVKRKELMNRIIRKEEAYFCRQRGGSCDSEYPGLCFFLLRNNKNWVADR